MIYKVYFKKRLLIKMSYTETKVLLGGLAHIPIIILFFYVIKIRFNRHDLEYKNN